MKQNDVYIGQKANFPYITYLHIDKTVIGLHSIFLFKKVFQNKISEPIKNVLIF